MRPKRGALHAVAQRTSVSPLMTDEHEFVDDDPEYADEHELEDDPDLADLPRTDPKDMPPDQGDTPRGNELPGEEG